MKRLLQIGIVLAALPTVGCQYDRGQARLCGDLLVALEPHHRTVEILRVEAPAAPEYTTILHYRVVDDSGRSGQHWIACRFAGGPLSPRRLSLDTVSTDRLGILSDVRLHMLKIWLNIFPLHRGTSATAEDAQTIEALHEGLYFVQQIINALVPICIYSVLAIGFTMVFAILERINLAFSAIAMVGGFTTFLLISLVASIDQGARATALLVALLGALSVGAGYGVASYAAVFRPLRSAHPQIPLVASIGLILLIQEAVRLLQGARDRWIQPIFSQIVVLDPAGGFALTISLGQAVSLGFAAAVIAGLLVMFAGTAFGRSWRACADDPAMAALVGVNVDRINGGTFALGAACAAAAGYLMVVYYGQANFFMGHLAGFKALAAAIVGGIGSIPGAIIGAVLIGLTETMWTAYLTPGYRDIAVFVLLTATLIFRPNGVISSARPPQAFGPRRSW